MLIVVFLYAEKYFDMKKNQCKEALEIYKTFLNRMTKLSEFLKVAEVTSLCAAALPQRKQRERERESRNKNICLEWISMVSLILQALSPCFFYHFATFPTRIILLRK